MKGLTAAFRAITDFFLFSSCYTALVATVMVTQTSLLLLHEPAPPSLLALVFFATLSSYNFHWYLSVPPGHDSDITEWNRLHPNLHILLFAIGTAGALWMGWNYREHCLALSPAVILTFLYSAPKIPWGPFYRLKDWAYGKTIYLAMVWMYVTSILPIFLMHRIPEGWHTAYFAGRFLLIYAICILFDLRDREADIREGIKSMITYFSPANVRKLFFASLLLSSVAHCLLYTKGFSLLSIGCFLVPILITGSVYRAAQQTRSDYYYYGFLDGLMMLSALLTFFLPF